MSRMGRAEARARSLYPRAPHFRGAYMKGVRAAVTGRVEDDCPYRVDPTRSWLVAFRKAWLRGFKSMRGGS